MAGTPWFFVNDIDLGVNPNDEVDYNTWTILINILLRSRELLFFFPKLDKIVNIGVSTFTM